MIKIRLFKTGKRNAVSFRIVVADSRTRRDGRIIENLGSYNPRVKPADIKIDQKRLDFWLARGAQPTSVVKKIIEGKKIE